MAFVGSWWLLLLAPCCLEASGSAKQSLAAPGCPCSPFGVTLGCPWLLLAAPGCSCLLMAPVGSWWLLLLAPCCPWQLLVLRSTQRESVNLFKQKSLQGFCEAPREESINYMGPLSAFSHQGHYLRSHERIVRGYTLGKNLNPKSEELGRTGWDGY